LLALASLIDQQTMSKTRADFADSNNPDTIIGKGVEIKGTLQTRGDIQVNGAFSGKLIAEGDVVVGEHGFVEADISGANVYVSGEVAGDIHAIEKIQILETGRVTGDVTSSAMAIESGGILKGSSTMLETEEEKLTIDPTFEVEASDEPADSEAK
jgi:cytoskeletal protein CcmA (bactofilin family)